ncbi:MAG: cysteine--tRNA ligase [Nitrospiraceae bacterium]
MLKIYNTMTGRKEVFTPLVPKAVRMYVCGVTVYDECHLGHARSALVFETIRRYLQYSHFKVTFVKNFTDVDDKIINRANELGIPWRAVTAKYIKAYYRDMKRLGIRRPTVEPKATTHMADIIGLVRALLRKGVAYQVDGDVYFQVEKFPAYGALSKRKLDDMQAGARVEVDERKRNPMDFALWKSSKPGEPAWDSPWGPGRPGWHIECSAMSMKHLGKTFDIHGGGMDLIFPHHENEIAQSRGGTGKEFVRYWVHNGFVQVNQEKMSKSLGNFFTVREVFEKSPWPEEMTGEVLRYFLLTTHYRTPLDFSDQALQEAQRALDGFYGLFQRLDESSPKKGTGDLQLRPFVKELEQRFRQVMDDDFNSPAAIAALHGLRGEINRLLDSGLSRQVRDEAVRTLRKHGNVFGLFQIEAKNWRFSPPPGASTGMDQMPQVRTRPPAHGGPMDQSGTPLPLREAARKRKEEKEEEEIQRKVDERSEARRRKDFKRADEIRAELASFGITIEDRPDGTSRWKR